jgi:manganese-dependent inorganic pyrophosphatase
VKTKKNKKKQKKTKETKETEITEKNMQPYVPTKLKGAIFIGHLVPDLDSVAGAIAAAELYGGKALCTEELNSETQYCLNYWGFSSPRCISDVDFNEIQNSSFCLIDHQQVPQIHPLVPRSKIVGIIDHHALQNATIVTDFPVHVDIRPWGSVSTIVAHQFYLIQGQPPSQKLAGLLLSAILSDTLNLNGPTTTQMDMDMVKLLARVAGVEKNLEDFVEKQFQAKSEVLKQMSALQLCQLDRKLFSFKSAEENTVKICFSVIETTDDMVVLEKEKELFHSLEMIKKNSHKEFNIFYLAVVNIVSLRSTILCSDLMETHIGCVSFGSVEHEIVYTNDNKTQCKIRLNKLVSRKNDFIPLLSKFFSVCVK